MANVVDIIASTIIALIVLAVSFYLFALYCHQERGFGTTLPPKILVIVSQAIAWGQLLLLPLDLSITSSEPGGNFLLAYEIIYGLAFAMVAFVNPLAMNFYESDQSDSFGSRLGWSILYSLITAFVWGAVIFISYIWLGVYPSPSGGGDQRLNAALYLLVAMGLVGWILLAFNGGIGLAYLPFDLILAFVDRPKHLTPEEAFNKKQELQTRSGALITQGEKLQEKQRQVGKIEGGWFSKKRGQAKFNKLLQGYKRDVNKLEEDYEVFDNQLKIKGRHPVVYVVSLVGGCVGVVVSLFWVVQILGTMILRNASPLFLFMDQWLSSLSSSSVSFLATILYSLLVLYLQACLVKGNTIFGIRVPFILKIHPLLLNKTFMNSLLFNCNLMLLSSMATSLLAVWAFPTYLAGSSLGMLSNQGFDHLPLFSAIYGNRIPMIVMEVIVLLTVLVIAGRGLWRRWKRKGKEEAKEK